MFYFILFGFSWLDKFNSIWPQDSYFSSFSSFNLSKLHDRFRDPFFNVSSFSPLQEFLI